MSGGRDAIKVTSQASQNTARDLQVAHAHAALHGDGMCDSLSDARHVRVV